MKYTIKAEFKRTLNGETTFIMVTWETTAEDMCYAITKARTYIKITEEKEKVICIWADVEVKNA